MWREVIRSGLRKWEFGDMIGGVGITRCTPFERAVRAQSSYGM